MAGPPSRARREHRFQICWAVPLALYPRAPDLARDMATEGEPAGRYDGAAIPAHATRFTQHGRASAGARILKPRMRPFLAAYRVFPPIRYTNREVAVQARLASVIQERFAGSYPTPPQPGDRPCPVVSPGATALARKFGTETDPLSLPRMTCERAPFAPQHRPVPRPTIR